MSAPVRIKEEKPDPDDNVDDDDNTTADAPPEEAQQNHPLVSCHLPMPYTVEEEAWLGLQLRNFRKAYSEVSLGKDLASLVHTVSNSLPLRLLMFSCRLQIKEFVMFSYDVPLAKSFVPTELAAFSERCRKIMKIHPEFDQLGDDQKARGL